MRGRWCLYTLALTRCYERYVIITFSVVIGMPARSWFTWARCFGYDRHLRVFLIFFIRRTAEIGGRTFLRLVVLVLLTVL